MGAIQVMATQKYDSSSIDKWTDRMGEPLSVAGGSWLDVFKDHPEFFHLETWTDPREQKVNTLASLTWRRANEKTYDPETGATLTLQQAAARDRSTLNRQPLNADQVGTLLTAAVELDTRAHALQERRDRLWTTGLTILNSLISALVGALIGASAR